MSAYFSESMDQCSRAMRQATKEVFANNKDHYLSFKTITRSFSSKWECFVQEAVYHVRIEATKGFPNSAICQYKFAWRKIEGFIFQKKKLRNSRWSSKIFKKSNIDWFIDILDKVFFDGKYSASNDYVEFLVHDHTSDTNKSIESGSEEYQTDDLQDNFVAENHEENGYPKPTKLIKFK